MRFPAVFLCSVSLLFGCKSALDQEVEKYCQEGILSEKSKFDLKNVLLDSVQFADGNFRYLMSGDLQLNGTKHSYSIVMKYNPFCSDLDNVISHNFPFVNYDSDTFSCYVYRANDDLITEWVCGMKYLRLHIDKDLISVR